MILSTAKPAAPPDQRDQAPSLITSKPHRPAVYANYYGAQDAAFSANWCACLSVYRELKNASWVLNFGFTIEVYVNIQQFSSLKTTGMADIYFPWGLTRLGYHSTPACSISMDSTFFLFADMGSTLS